MTPTIDAMNANTAANAIANQSQLTKAKCCRDVNSDGTPTSEEAAMHAMKNWRVA